MIAKKLCKIKNPNKYKMTLSLIVFFLSWYKIIKIKKPIANETIRVAMTIFSLKMFVYIIFDKSVPRILFTGPLYKKLANLFKDKKNLFSSVIFAIFE